jgi:gas vesicle protein
MSSKLPEVTSRNFNPMLAPGLSDEARKAVKAAFEAMSTWRTEIVNDNEKNAERVIDKIAAAARALGWPEEIAETTRAQMQTINRKQLQMVDHMMDAWEGQISSPGSSSSILSKLRSSPPLSPVASWPFAGTSQMADPFGAYMQVAQQWQKACTDAMAFWMKVGKPN